ncbi:uncharacterized protein LOC113863960 [Abrus precatorius]|uniref:Uncharacterized protein LOC113863960 n=1 Tax=Abrus precatorius TaxID=3816 RepID=A0A8B8LE34_ABRPR|nr:uncharacterized protein LOC113863960 [Abrus precatorius]
MDSPHNGKGPSKESFSNESSSPPPVAPPHMMYYQPGMGYPAGHGAQPPAHLGYAPGYPAYPQPQPQAYHYPAAPAAYYNAPPTYYNGGGGNKVLFMRGFILCFCLLFTGLFIATLVMALVLHPYLPIYTVNSLSVVNFNTTQTLTGDWNISITVQNSNERLKGVFSDFKVELLYNNDMLAVSYEPDFQLDNYQYKNMNPKPSSNGLTFPKWEIDEIANQRAKGSLPLSLRLTSTVSFKSTTMSTRDSLVIAVCSDLNVVFRNDTGNGAMETGGVPIKCQLFV